LAGWIDEARPRLLQRNRVLLTTASVVQSAKGTSMPVRMSEE
jgi:hypothetical protein